MATADWYPDWIAAHTGRFPRGDWPDSGAEFWDTLRHVFVTKGVTREVADEASRLLFENPPQFATDHPKALLEKIREVWKTTRAPAAAVDDPEEAKRLSAGCEECGAAGITYRFFPAGDGTPRRFPQVAFYCVCPYGRFVEKNHRAKSPDLRKRFHDLAEHPELWAPPAEGDHSAFHAAAASHWADLTDDERETWRDLVRKRCPALLRGPKFTELMAQAWAYDPSWIISLSPKHEPAALTHRGPRRVFDALPAPSPKPKG